MKRLSLSIMVFACLLSGCESTETKARKNQSTWPR